MVHPLLERIDQFWWSSYDFRRLWTPRFLLKNERTSALIYLIIRSIATAFLFSTAVFDASETNSTPSFYIAFLTIQGVWLTICYFVSVTLLSFVTFLKPYLCNYSNPAVPEPKVWHEYIYYGWLRATHVLFEIALCYEFIIVVLYWTLLSGNHVTPKAWYKDIAVHGLMFAFIWTELLVSSHRLPDRHSIIIFGTTIGYIIWNIAVTFTVHYVYPVLKWDGVGSVILAIGSIIFAILVFFLGSSVAYIRDYLAAEYCHNLPHKGAEDCVCCMKDGRCCWTMNKITIPSSSSTKVSSTGESKENNQTTNEMVVIPTTTEPVNKDQPMDWSTIYPRSFTDDILAWPCSSCKGCRARNSPISSSSVHTTDNASTV